MLKLNHLVKEMVKVWQVQDLKVVILQQKEQKVQDL